MKLHVVFEILDAQWSCNGKMSHCFPFFHPKTNRQIIPPSMLNAAEKAVSKIVLFHPIKKYEEAKPRKGRFTREYTFDIRHHSAKIQLSILIIRRAISKTN